MAGITAAAVKALRDKTGLPMMDCKNALKETEGDEAAAIDVLRKKGLKTMEKRSGRATSFGRMGVYADLSDGVGAMVELKCESAPVAAHEEFIGLANDLARQLAKGPVVQTTDELLDQPSPSQDGKTLRDQKDELFNRIREVFNVRRIVRIDSACGGYSHNASTVSGVLLAIEGGNDEAAKDVCMHVAAMRPAGLNKEDIDHEEVEKERVILRESALQEGKPENIVDKMVEGRLRSYFAERVLTEQAYVKEPKISVGQYAKDNGMTIKQFVHWELGKD